ncbi:MAG: cupin domain-containing protein [Bacteroidia bacterium]|nr:cupin domain-containing protein [Bacteroidia bacterium]NNF31693.1 cupin domain-containing protein [Flavobacteriaceae bacterium]NNJ81552.1 cupin domain-containing protein [Flavobacteriaceae bacterium]NNK55207.1 cupin domain-containing protein [Flavobacteriaceae bacterium]NNM10202.1 cupin domain-containing protein [Flavobacteriaceae bacterium]
MFSIEKQIKETSFEGLSVQKIFKNENAETLLITLEKNYEFPEHSSPRDAFLVMLEGSVIFTIQNTDYALNCSDSFTFPAEEPHKVYAKENSKFLIIR